MRKVLDMAISTNSYDEFIGICHGFILDKQAIQARMEEGEFNIKNPIISTRKGRPAGRAKSNVEIQDQCTKKRRYFQPLELNNQINQITNEFESTNDGTREKDKRKTCQNCGNKGHNKATCKINKN